MAGNLSRPCDNPSTNGVGGTAVTPLDRRHEFEQHDGDGVGDGVQPVDEAVGIEFGARRAG